MTKIASLTRILVLVHEFVFFSNPPFKTSEAILGGVPRFQVAPWSLRGTAKSQQAGAWVAVVIWKGWKFEKKKKYQKSQLTGRIISVSKWLVAPIYKRLRSI